MLYRRFREDCQRPLLTRSGTILTPAKSVYIVAFFHHELLFLHRVMPSTETATNDSMYESRRMVTDWHRHRLTGALAASSHHKECTSKSSQTHFCADKHRQVFLFLHPQQRALPLAGLLLLHRDTILRSEDSAPINFRAAPPQNELPKVILLHSQQNGVLPDYRYIHTASSRHNNDWGMCLRRGFVRVLTTAL